MRIAFGLFDVIGKDVLETGKGKGFKRILDRGWGALYLRSTKSPNRSQLLLDREWLGGP